MRAMKTVMKWAGGFVALVLAAAFLDDMPRIERIVICGFAALAFALYTMEKAATARHAQIIDRLDRLAESRHQRPFVDSE